jgi:D-alanyl-D-alanine dipeptidase
VRAKRPSGKPSPSEPVSLLKRVPIAENGEPLVNFLDYCPKLILDKPRWKYERETLARESVVRMLARAADLLPKGYRLAVIEGWRPHHIQRRMWMGAYEKWKERHPDYSHAALVRLTNRFTAPLSDKVPPPHSTGGAVDVSLVDGNGRPFDLTAPYEFLSRRGFPLDADGLSESARVHRRILADALLETGLTNYPSEYWHWSYGDQGWAYRGGHPHAHFGATAPDGWSPREAEDIDEPLEWIHQSDNR